MEKIKVLAVVGPTASGKTSLAAGLAKKYGGEVISCDSMQVYKHMNIAAAVPTEEEMQGVPHHLIDFLEPCKKFSVADYVELAHRTAAEIAAKNKLPVICGGTGLYFNSFIDNIKFSEAKADYEYRAELKKRAETEGSQVLLDELSAFDKETADSLSPNNLGRIIRAMEHYHITGRTISEQREQSRKAPSPYDAVIIGINYYNRENLYSRIDSRVDIMVHNGLIAEAREFYEKYAGDTSSAAIGYKELKPYLDGKCSLDEALENLKMSTRRFAKRQLTWFRRDERIHWIYGDDKKTPEEQADEYLKDKI